MKWLVMVLCFSSLSLFAGEKKEEKKGERPGTYRLIDKARR